MQKYVLHSFVLSQFLNIVLFYYYYLSLSYTDERRFCPRGRKGMQLKHIHQVPDIKITDLTITEVVVVAVAVVVVIVTTAISPMNRSPQKKKKKPQILVQNAKYKTQIKVRLLDILLFTNKKFVKRKDIITFFPQVHSSLGSVIPSVSIANVASSSGKFGES